MKTPPLAERKSRAKIDLAWKRLAEADERRLEMQHILSAKFPKLTKSDVKICVLLRESLPSYKIAELLGVSVHTIENHRSRIHKKLRIPSADDLSAFFNKF